MSKVETTYYGRIDDVVPKSKMHHFVLDELIKRSYEIELEKFQKKLEQSIDKLREYQSAKITSLDKAVKSLSDKLSKLEVKFRDKEKEQANVRETKG